jgi:ribosomal-protein-alanine N-acetyltransferase
MPVVTLRPMALQDVEQVHVLDQLSFPIPWPESSYRFELTAQRNSSLWVAEVLLPDGTRQVVGMVVVWVILDEAHVATFAVHPDYRRQGIGKRLLVRALIDAAEKGAEHAFLEVRRTNSGAQNLYRQLGFEPVGLRPRYYSDNGEDAILMNQDHLSAQKLWPILNGQPASGDERS